LRPYLRKWYYARFAGVAIGDFWVLKIINNNHPLFIYYLIQTEKYQRVANDTSGTKMPRSDWKKVSESLFYIPNINEQKKISTIFNIIDNLITLHQRKLEQLEQLKNTLLSKMFPKSGTNIPEIRFSGFTDAWKQRKLGEVVIRLDNLRIPITESNRVSGPTPYYGANGIQDYVEGYTHDGEYILIAEDGANDTNNYPIFRVHGKIWVNNHAHVLQTIDDIADNDYVAYALKSINIGPYLVGGSRSKLNADSLMKLEIKLPKLSEQIKVGQIFVKIDYQIKNYKQKLKNLKTIKKSLLNKLFI
ncbi:restriction endonuclease subunit S, partial [Enterococcus cecorum]|nr:restriction endonuclease subunit S [Enterococcus cecorum]